MNQHPIDNLCIGVPKSWILIKQWMTECWHEHVGCKSFGCGGAGVGQCKCYDLRHEDLEALAVIWEGVRVMLSKLDFVMLSKHDFAQVPK